MNGAKIRYPLGAMGTRPRLILASTSPYRRALLERLRLPFAVVSPRWDEVRLEDPTATVRANSLGKARAVAAIYPEEAILASDQVAYCEGRILEKPGTASVAEEQLGWIAGREHTLHTCVVLRQSSGTEEYKTIVARLKVRALSSEQISSYVRLEAPLDCAGSYKGEGLGISLFEYLRCDDPTAIEGLPLITTCKLLLNAGFDPLETAGSEAC